jgi:hypothetical protein
MSKKEITNNELAKLITGLQADIADKFKQADERFKQIGGRLITDRGSA